MSRIKIQFCVTSNIAMIQVPDISVRLLIALSFITFVFWSIYIITSIFTRDYKLAHKEIPVIKKNHLSPLKDFYQNLNNSSQYLRRDSFSQI